MTRTSIMPVLLTAVGAVAWPPSGAPQSPSPPSQTVLLARVATYLDAYTKAFGAAVADESYSQSSKPPSYVGSSTRHRQLKADLMLLDLAGDWVEFRDVYEVDGKRVRDHDARLQALLSGPSTDPLARAQRIAEESARYNLGASRNINVPTMALAFLERRSQARSAFKELGTATVPAGRARILAFTETAKPTLIRAGSVDISTQGRAWIAPDTGAVLRTQLTLAVPQPWGLTGTVTVTYAFERTLNLLAPVRMDEEYTLDTGEVDRGDATYSNFHTFGVDTTTLVHRGGGTN